MEFSLTPVFAPRAGGHGGVVTAVLPGGQGEGSLSHEKRGNYGGRKQI